MLNKYNFYRIPKFITNHTAKTATKHTTGKKITNMNLVQGFEVALENRWPMSDAIEHNRSVGTVYS